MGGGEYLSSQAYKCINESGETTHKKTACVNARQEEILEHKTQNQKNDAKVPGNGKDDEKYMADIRKRLDAYGERALERQKSSAEEAIKGGYAVAGMSKSQVRKAMGEPTSVMGPDYSMGTSSETWIYEQPDITQFVFFTGGKVTSMSGHLY